MTGHFPIAKELCLLSLSSSRKVNLLFVHWWITNRKKSIKCIVFLIGAVSLGLFWDWIFKTIILVWLALISFSSVQFSRSVVSDSLRPHELQHARPPCPSPLPEFTQTHVHWVGDAIQSSHPRSSPSPPAPNPSQHQSLFQWVNSSHEVAKVLEFQL